MNYSVTNPHWGAWIAAYFFLGGIAAGSYFLAMLIEWFGSDKDQPLARIAYWLAFPLVLICGTLLVVDLNRPERFWHMLVKSEIAKAALVEGFPLTADGWRLAVQTPMLKYWSPMSIGSWGLAVFGACAFTSFLGVLWPRGRVVRWLQAGWAYRVLQTIGCLAGFFVASYTGTLLSATNQPLWSDTSWLASLFLISAFSTSLATLTLIAGWKNIGSCLARERLAGTEPLVLGLELVVLGMFFLSLGDYLNGVLMTRHGILLVVGVAMAGVLLPLLLHAHLGHRRKWAIPMAAVFVLLGGLLLRYAILAAPTEILQRRSTGTRRISPEDGRPPGAGRGADVGNYTQQLQPRTKLPSRNE